MLEDDAQQSDRNRRDYEQPSGSLVGVGAQSTENDAARERSHDRVPLRSIEDDQCKRGSQMQHDDECQKRSTRPIDVVPVQQCRNEDRMTQARDRKELADSLQESQRERL